MNSDPINYKKEILETFAKQIPFCNSECSTKWMTREKYYDTKTSKP